MWHMTGGQTSLDIAICSVSHTYAWVGMQVPKSLYFYSNYHTVSTMADQDLQQSIRAQEVDKFDGQGFSLWKFKVKKALRARDYWRLVKGKELQPVDEGTPRDK